MSKIEQYIIIFLGFFIFGITFIRLGFFIGATINEYTLPLIILSYLSGLVIIYSSNIFNLKQGFEKYLPILFFSVTIFIFAVIAQLLGFTYDTSWDGQGYHQSAVIALSNNWNPLYDPSIDFAQVLPSQIFAEGYPSALWELEASVYSLTDRINSAKVFNFAIAFLAAVIVYSLTRKLKLPKILSVIISILIALQPVYLIQLLSFMADGFGYELLVIAACSLAIVAFSPKSYWAIATFLMAELFLVTTKYSHLPVSLVLGIIFGLIVFNRILNYDYRINKNSITFTILFVLTALIFATIPYFRNQFHHSAMFYPTNIPDLMGSVKYNNVPNNLQDSNKLSLLFHGIFSKAQTKESGDPRSETNVADLKIPFSFSPKEINDSATLYNNRVGGGGPFFSGLVVLSLILVTYLYIKAESKKQRYAIYASLFTFMIIIVLSLLAPTPNLLRYTNQLQLIPFAVIIPIYAVFNKPFIKIFCFIILAVSAVNLILFGSAIFAKSISEANAMNKQMADLRKTDLTYQVKAQQFYSSYILLKEQNVKFEITDSLKCQKVERLFSSSTTTQYCFK